MASTNCNGLTLRSNTTVPLTNPQMDNNFTVLCNTANNALTLANTLNSQLQYGTSGTSTTKFTGDQFNTLRTEFNTLQTDFGILNTKTGIVNKLGFTPVQQGGIAGYGNNNVIIGWSNATTGSSVGKLLVQVDATNFAETWPINVSSANSVDWNNVINKPSTSFLTSSVLSSELITWQNHFNLQDPDDFPNTASSSNNWDAWNTLLTWAKPVPTGAKWLTISSVTNVVHSTYAYTIQWKLSTKNQSNGSNIQHFISTSNGLGDYSIGMGVMNHLSHSVENLTNVSIQLDFLKYYNQNGNTGQNSTGAWVRTNTIQRYTADGTNAFSGTNWPVYNTSTLILTWYK